MTEVDPGRVLAETATVAGVDLPTIVALPERTREPPPSNRWGPDPLTVARLAAVLVLDDLRLRQREIARLFGRSPMWVTRARRLARSSAVAGQLATEVRERLARRRRPSPEEIDAILRRQRAEAQG